MLRHWQTIYQKCSGAIEEEKMNGCVIEEKKTEYGPLPYPIEGYYMKCKRQGRLLRNLRTEHHTEGIEGDARTDSRIGKTRKQDITTSEKHKPKGREKDEPEMKYGHIFDHILHV